MQQFSTPSKFPGFDRSGSQTPQQQQNQEDYAVLFAALISRCAKDIDTLIESLPSEESSTELQVQSLRRLEAENKEAAEQLEEVSISTLLICFCYDSSHLTNITKSNFLTLVSQPALAWNSFVKPLGAASNNNLFNMK